MATIAHRASAVRWTRERRGRLVLAGCTGLAGAGFIASLALGPVAIELGELLAIAGKQVGLGDAGAVSPVKVGVVEAIRAPRALLGLAAGAALGAAGAAMQGSLTLLDVLSASPSKNSRASSKHGDVPEKSC